jgi:hypothetical protein
MKLFGRQMPIFSLEQQPRQRKALSGRAQSSRLEARDQPAI